MAFALVGPHPENVNFDGFGIAVPDGFGVTTSPPNSGAHLKIHMKNSGTMGPNPPTWLKYREDNAFDPPWTVWEITYDAADIVATYRHPSHPGVIALKLSAFTVGATIDVPGLPDNLAVIDTTRYIVPGF